VKKLLDAGIHREQYHFRLDGSQMDKIFSGPAPLGNNGQLTTLKEPRQSFPIPMAPERVEEFAPGLDPELQELADALSDFKEKLSKQGPETNGKKPKK
jgi:Mn-containing catalase